MHFGDGDTEDEAVPMSGQKPLLLWLEARKLGLVLKPDGDRLVVKPARLCPPDLAEELREHKSELLAFLSHPCRRQATTWSWPDDPESRVAGLHRASKPRRCQEQATKP